MNKSFSIIALSGFSLLMAMPASPQMDPGLHLREVMTAIIAPMTNRIWAASDVQTDTQWLELEQAALTVIAAGALTLEGGPDGTYVEQSKNADWQEYTQQMMAAARSVIAAVRNHDETALFNAGNDDLYPPCENCHARYLPR